METDMNNGSHEHNDVLRFRVSIRGEQVDAYLSQVTCQADHEPWSHPVSPADFYREHRPALDQIVQDKVKAGARCPVVLMVRDLQP